MKTGAKGDGQIVPVSGGDVGGALVGPLPGDVHAPGDGLRDKAADRAAYMRFLRRMSNPKTMRVGLVEKFNDPAKRSQSHPTRVLRPYTMVCTHLIL